MKITFIRIIQCLLVVYIVYIFILVILFIIFIYFKCISKIYISNLLTAIESTHSYHFLSRFFKTMY